MKIDYEKLDVYHAAIDFVVTSNNIIEALPRGRQYLTGTAIDRQYLSNFLQSSSLYCLNVTCDETEYHWQSNYPLPTTVTDKIIQESDQELLQLLTDNRIGLTVADQSKYLQLTDLARRGAKKH